MYGLPEGHRQGVRYPKHLKGHITVFLNNVQEFMTNVLPLSTPEGIRARTFGFKVITGVEAISKTLPCSRARRYHSYV
ncbi:hypothetical protein B0T26DRAFT_691372, partial [Lasiosphaeria miniovina]